MEETLNQEATMMSNRSALVRDIAERRIAALANESEAFARRDSLRAQLEANGLSAVAEAELRLLEETCAEIEDGWERQAQSEQQAESAWLRAAEYDPRMDDPREW
jgi:hypothetical protein